MFWVGTALLVVLVAIAGCLTYLLLVRNRKHALQRRSIQPPPTDKASTVEVEMPVDGPTSPRAEPAEHAGSESHVASGEEALASSHQVCDVPDTTETMAPEVEPAHLQEPPCPEGERDFSELPATGILDIEQEIIPPSVEAQRESQAPDELRSEQNAERDLESDAGKPAVPVEEAQPPSDEPPSTNRFEKVETVGTQAGTPEDAAPDDSADSRRADVANEEPGGADEPEHETPGEDLQAQCPAAAAHAGPVADQPVTEPTPSPQTEEDVATREPEASALGDLSNTRHHAEVGEHSDAAPGTIAEGQAEKPAEAGAPVQVPIARGGMPAGIERKPDTATKQSVALSRPKAQKVKRNKAKATKKKKPRQQPSRTRAEESGDAGRLLAEVPEYTENIRRHWPRRPPRPSRYRPPSQEPVTVPQPSRSRHPMRQARKQRFDLTLRLLFQRSGHFRLGLLPQRRAELPEEIALGPEGNRHTVAAVHDGWYEDIYPEELSALLVDGISWEGRSESEVLGYWTLSGRDLYVLTTHNDLNGFAQATRLKIGREHIVLCRNSLLALVEPILHQVGCAGFIKLDESHGAPSGWTVIRGAPSERKVIRGIVPTNVVSVESGPEILSILQSEPDLEIDLQGGIYLQQATWLHGFPPRICVSGDLRPEVEVFIDGNMAVAGDDGSFTNQGYDAVGEHAVSIPVANTSKTYRMTEGEVGWTLWDAHSLAGVQLCGPLLMASDTSAMPRAVVVPSSNSVILGAKPGDIAYCPRIRGPRQVGCVTFHAVWAIPFDAFGCDRKTTIIRLLSARRLVQTQRHQFRGKKAARVMAWSAAILNASRKGLLVDTSDPHGPVLWKEYKSHARSLWKMLKR